MNAHDRDLAARDADLAVVHYGDADVAVLRPGRYVLCAMTGVKIPLQSLKYWSAALQEAYAGPQEALDRWKQLNG